MKKVLWAAAALMLVFAAATPSAWADGDDAGAAALGFFLGTMVQPPNVVYSVPPPVVYGPPQVIYENPPAVVVPAPDYDDGYAPPPRVYYYHYRDDDRPAWHGRWHHDGRGHRHWRRVLHHDDD